jgi:hypothetical protein
MGWSVALQEICDGNVPVLVATLSTGRVHGRVQAGTIGKVDEEVTAGKGERGGDYSRAFAVGDFDINVASCSSRWTDGDGDKVLEVLLVHRHCLVLSRGTSTTVRGRTSSRRSRRLGTVID